MASINEKDSVKNASPADTASSQNDIEKGEMHEAGGKGFNVAGRKTSVAGSIVAAELLDDRYAITKRGLKSRHAQMIALGGTIGTGCVCQSRINRTRNAC
jgi:amino acid permease